MDTILYFYQTAGHPAIEQTKQENSPLRPETVKSKIIKPKASKSETLCKIQPVIYEMQGYLLVQVGLTKEQRQLLMSEEKNANDPHRTLSDKTDKAKQKKSDKSRRELPWRRAHRQKQEKRNRQQLLSALQELLGSPFDTWCVCEPPLKFFDDWTFEDYWEEKWVMHLMPYAVQTHFVILGWAPCLTQVLPRYARRMKSLRLILCEQENTEDMEGLLQELLEEDGIVADVQLLQDREDYRKLRTLSLFPCNVLDFSGEERMFPSTVPEGSVWLDFSSDEEKRRRMELQKDQIQYVSLKKEWRQPQNNWSCLDTAGKNRYNT